MRHQLLPRLRQLLDTAVSTALSTTPPLGADLEELRALFDKAAVDIATPRATGVERALAMARSEDADEMVRYTHAAFKALCTMASQLCSHGDMAPRCPCLARSGIAT